MRGNQTRVTIPFLRSMSMYFISVPALCYLCCQISMITGSLALCWSFSFSGEFEEPDLLDLMPRSLGAHCLQQPVFYWIVTTMDQGHRWFPEAHTGCGHVFASLLSSGLLSVTEASKKKEPSQLLPPDGASHIWSLHHLGSLLTLHFLQWKHGLDIKNSLVSLN